MTNGVHFDGDPETESARRHMERVLKGTDPPRRWTWLLAALGTGGVWLLWQGGRAAARTRDSVAPDSSKSPG